jgi:glycosyltransferase involved in cell wall biosynthesis
MITNLVSILIPVFNREKYIEATIKSALEQTHPDIEVIVVDNCSQDNTWQIISAYAEKDSRIKCFRNDTNIGPVKNWEKCIGLAQGNYGKILWSDDLLHPTFIEKTLPHLADCDVGCVFTSVKVFNEDSGGEDIQHRIGKTGRYSSKYFIKYALIKAKYPRSPGCAIFRLKDLREVFRVDIPNRHNINFSQHAIGNDLIIFLLTMLKYPKFAFVDSPLSLFRAHSGSITHSTRDGRLPLFYALAKAWFLEQYCTDKKAFYLHNAYLVVLVRLFRRHPSGLVRVSDFYISNKDCRTSMCYIIQVLFFLMPGMFRFLKKYIGA